MAISGDELEKKLITGLGIIDKPFFKSGSEIVDFATSNSRKLMAFALL